MSADPVAVVDILHRVPPGFHALFVTEVSVTSITYGLNFFLTFLSVSLQLKLTSWLNSKIVLKSKNLGQPRFRQNKIDDDKDGVPDIHTFEITSNACLLLF